MQINEIIIYIMVLFMIIGAIDKCFGNRYGYGEKFDEGIMAMGPLALAMIGIISLSPIIAQVLKPIISPIYTSIGADPAMFATTILANDMGGYSLAMELAINPQIGKFAGLILGAMMGPTIVFTIPYALGIIEKKDREFLAKGVLAGVTVIPIGAFVSGILAGLSVNTVLINLFPIIVVGALLSIGLWKIPDAMTKGFTIFGKGVITIITVGLAISIFQYLTKFIIIPGMVPLEESVSIVGSIAVTLAGAFPLVLFITKVFAKPLSKLGEILGMNESGVTGMVASLANTIPMFGTIKDMDNKGKIFNIAFAVNAGFVFGDNLGFTAGIDSSMIFPMIVGKLTGGICAVLLAKTLFKNVRN